MKLSSFRDFSFLTLVESDRREMAVVGEKEKVIRVCVCVCVFVAWMRMGIRIVIETFFL